MVALMSKQRRIMRLGLGLVLIGTLFLAKSTQQVRSDDATIDSFDSWTAAQIPMGGTNPSSADACLVDPGVFSGERDIYVVRTDGNQNASAVSNDYLSQYTHGQEPGVRSHSWVTWDGPDNNADPHNPDLTKYDIDLDMYGATAFEVKVAKVDVGLGMLTINLWDTTGRTAASTKTLNQIDLPGETYVYPFSGFSAESGFDWDHVAAIQLEVDGEGVEDLDVRIDWIAFNGPTAVDVTDFSAASTKGHILVAWETGSETSMQGFNLHRSEAADGVYTELNPTVIPAQNHGQPIGAAYSWLDEDVVPGGTYYYKLEALEDGGLSSFFGPVSARAVHLLYLPLVSRN